MELSWIIWRVRLACRRPGWVAVVPVVSWPRSAFLLVLGCAGRAVTPVLLEVGVVGSVGMSWWPGGFGVAGDAEAGCLGAGEVPAEVVDALVA